MNNPFRFLRKKLDVLRQEQAQRELNKPYHIQFYNCWNQPITDMYWYRFIQHRKLLDQYPDMRVSIFSIFGRRKMVDKIDSDVKLFFSGENLKKDRSADYADHCLGNKNIDLAMGLEMFEHERYVRFPLWMDYMFDPEMTPQDIIRKCDQLRFPKITDKQKFTCFVASAPWDGLRKEMVDKVSQISRVDCGGRYLHNDDTLKTECNDVKADYLQRYNFNICPENDNFYGCVSEKVFEALASGCIPIYWGSYNKPEPDVLNQDAIIFWDRKTDNSAALAKIKELHDSPKLLKEFLEQPRLTPHAAEYVLDTFSTLEHKLKSVIESKAKQRYRQ